MAQQSQVNALPAAKAAEPPPLLPSGKLTKVQERQLGAALASYRRYARSPRHRAAAVEKAITYGPEGIARIRHLIVKDLEPQLSKYRGLFTEAAWATSQSRLQAISSAEVTQLRQSVLELTKEEQLTKPQIVAVADPAVARLGELLLMDRTEIFAKSPDLQTRREKMAELGRLWELCAVAEYRLIAQGTEKVGEQPNFQMYLQREEELAVKLAGPMTDQDRQVLAKNEKLAADLDPEESRCILELNLLRGLLGLNVLEIDPALVAASRDHSQDMRELKFFAHESPVTGKKTPWDRAVNFKTTADGENIFMGSPLGNEAHLAWFHSPGHFKNQLGDHRRIGVGKSVAHWTQMFGG
ncbi:MAG: CAP domain-containing protein [Pirellulales bacterium]|nr:CAP domain-containing protein [Pirellulales bacterium]